MDVPAETINLEASSKVIFKYITSSIGNISKKPLVGFGDILGFKQSGIKNFKLADPVHNHDLFILAEKEIKRIENNNEDISKFKPLIKLYDRADIINDIA